MNNIATPTTEISVPNISLGFTFSLGYSFSEQKLSKLSGEEDFLQEKILALAIENAESIYESALIDRKSVV